MTNETAHLIIDANYLMHFKRPDQVDWPDILKSKSVALLITPVLLRELEEQKVKNPSRKLRERAKQAISWLAPMFDSLKLEEIRPGVVMAFIRHSPLIKFADHRLSREINDDELIAAAIEYRLEHGCNVALLTADAGLRIKLPAHDIPAIVPPDELLLPEEPDEVERENARLRAAAARFANRQPDLRLTFFDGNATLELLCLKKQIEQEFPYASDFMTAGFLYNDYIDNFEKWKEKALLATPFAIRLENVGTAIAKNVQIELTGFPDFIEVFERGDPPEYPRLGGGTFPRPLFHGSDGPHYEDSNVVSFQVPDLVHRRRFESEMMWVRFLDATAIKNFSCTYFVTCVENIEPVSGKLHFLVGQHWG